MKNYYEILEVDKNASEEIIEKSYKTLAKKYHPDLQNEEKQKQYEEKMKLINEAYDVLSNEFKRKSYNETLQKETITREEYEKVLKENYMLREELNKINNYAVESNSTIENMSRMINNEINKVTRQAYQDAYVEDMRNRGYKIRYKHDLKYYLKLILIIIGTIAALFLIYQIPFVKTFCNNLYEENIVIKVIVDIIRNTITTGF